MRQMLARLWPDGLSGRTMLVLLAGLFALHVGSVWVHESSVRGNHQAARESAIAEGLLRARRALAVLPPDQRDRAAHALSSPGLELHWRGGSPPAEAAAEGPSLGLVRQWLLRNAPDLGDIRIGWGDAEQHHLLVGALPVDEAGSISFAAPIFVANHTTPFDPEAVASLAAIALVIALASIWVVRSLTRPLRNLSEAADRVGRDADMVRIAEEGPAEIRHAARAFNGMQDRIRRLLDDRTQALAAVSHDLRTPITRMRLVAGFLEDVQARDRIDANLDEMAAMVETTLDYLRGGQEAEEPRPTDIATVLQTICDGVSDTGADVAFDGPDRLVMPLRPVAMRRAISNLVGNAVIYGGSTRVSLRQDARKVEIEIADRGSGIPEAELERVFEPFRRLEESRNRATGGVGLGLAIARRVVEAEGGSLILRNRDGGGLSALVALPLRSAAARAPGAARLPKSPPHAAAASS